MSTGGHQGGGGGNLPRPTGTFGRGRVKSQAWQGHPSYMTQISMAPAPPPATRFFQNGVEASLPAMVQVCVTDTLTRRNETPIQKCTSPCVAASLTPCTKRQRWVVDIGSIWYYGARAFLLVSVTSVLPPGAPSIAHHAIQGVARWETSGICVA